MAYPLMAQELREQRGQKEIAIATILRLKKHIDRIEAENQRKDAEIERYRGALEGIEGFARMLCETQHQMHPAHLRLVAMITDAARAALKVTVDD